MAGKKSRVWPGKKPSKDIDVAGNNLNLVSWGGLDHYLYRRDSPTLRQGVLAFFPLFSQLLVADWSL